MTDPKDLKVDVLYKKKSGQTTFPDCDNFVRVEHVPSGITVTKHSNRSQIRAKEECMNELEILVELWGEK